MGPSGGEKPGIATAAGTARQGYAPSALGLAEAWLITLIALSSILARILNRHSGQVAGRLPRSPGAAGRAAVALELESEAEAVLRLMDAYVEARERYSVCLGADRPAPAHARHAAGDRRHGHARILPGAGLEDAKQVAERIDNKNGTEIGRITASFGIAQLKRR